MRPRSETTWPRIRALMDRAIQSERGIRVPYESYGVADRVRRSAYKIRDAMRKQSAKQFPDPEDPRHGVSPYDGLTFWVKTKLPRDRIEVAFLDSGEIKNLEELGVELTGHKGGERLFPGQAVSVRVLDPDDPEGKRVLAQVLAAPSFQAAWSILKTGFPADLVIENGYSTEHLEIEEL